MQPAKVELLPADIREELEARLVRGGFAGYDELVRWLAERGYSISRSSLHRYGASFKRRLAAIRLATAQARAITEAAPDDSGAVNDALTRLVQERLFAILVEADEAQVDQRTLARFARAIADLGRATIAQKAWAAKYREQVRARVAEAQGKIERAAGAGLSPEAVEAIRAALTGIVA